MLIVSAKVSFGSFNVVEMHVPESSASTSFNVVAMHVPEASASTTMRLPPVTPPRTSPLPFSALSSHECTSQWPCSATWLAHRTD
jgi:hypothetical protein